MIICRSPVRFSKSDAAMTLESHSSLTHHAHSRVLPAVSEDAWRLRGEDFGTRSNRQTGGVAAAIPSCGRARACRVVKHQGLCMTRRAAREVAATNRIDGDLSADELSIVLSALWIWRGQLGRVGSAQAIPGVGTAEARENVDEIARKLGGDPDAYFFGLDLSQRC
jgi:hypothetical protein